MKYIDDFLNGITMYRLVLYYLIFLVGAAVVLSILGILAFNPLGLIFSAIFLAVVAYITNYTFAKVFAVPANVESVYISALILALIITPITSIHGLPLLFWAAVWATAGKFIIAYKRKHLFNPAALAVFLTAVFLGQSASWWIGNAAMFLPVLAGGSLIVRKIRRWDLVGAFLISAVTTIFLFTFIAVTDLVSMLSKIFLEAPLLFFAFVMLTEPLMTPPTKSLRVWYGIIVGFLFAPQIHFGSIYLTPEMALLMGNMFSYFVSPRERLMLRLAQKKQLAPDTYDFIFDLNRRFNFLPGQYMEWTLKHHGVDDRGNRRYFTLASSPTEDNVRLGVKFYDRSSSFKKAMLGMNIGDRVAAGQLIGDFVLPKDPDKKLVFMAGGIGITPFRSMLKYLLDTNQKRDIVVLYANKTEEEIVYKDVLNDAEKRLPVKVVYTLTDTSGIPDSWLGKTGRINEAMITEEIPDYKERLFYLSGPHSMVDAYEKVLKDMTVAKENIIVDYFPGYV